MLRFNQLHAADNFRRLIRSLSLRPSWLLAPRADRTAATHGRVAPRALASGLSGRRGTPHACRISLRRKTENSAGGTSTLEKLLVSLHHPLPQIVPHQHPLVAAVHRAPLVE